MTEYSSHDLLRISCICSVADDSDIIAHGLNLEFGLTIYEAHSILEYANSLDEIDF